MQYSVSGTFVWLLTPVLIAGSLLYGVFLRCMPCVSNQTRSRGLNFTNTSPTLRTPQVSVWEVTYAFWLRHCQLIDSSSEWHRLGTPDNMSMRFLRIWMKGSIIMGGKYLFHWKQAFIIIRQSMNLKAWHWAQIEAFKIGRVWRLRINTGLRGRICWCSSQCSHSGVGWASTSALSARSDRRVVKCWKGYTAIRRTLGQVL